MTDYETLFKDIKSAPDHTLFGQLEYCHYEAVGGPLEMNVAFIELKRRMDDLRVAELRNTAEVARLKEERDAARKNEQRYMESFAVSNDDNEQLRNALEEALEMRDRCLQQTDKAEDANARLRSALAALVSEGEWHDAKDELTEEDFDPVYLYENEFCWNAAVFAEWIMDGVTERGEITYDFNTGKWYVDFEGERIYLDVTRWHPLPSPASPALAAAKEALKDAGEEAGG